MIRRAERSLNAVRDCLAAFFFLSNWDFNVAATILEKKVEADSLAYQLTRRQFEEGLSTAIDLHTTSAELLKSKATLLQFRLMAVVKEQLVKYYRGETIWTEQ